MINIQRFQQILKGNNLDGFIVTNQINIFYLCGFRGISQTEREAILVFSTTPTLIAPHLYQIEAGKLRSKELKISIVRERNHIWEKVREIMEDKQSFSANKQSTSLNKQSFSTNKGNWGFEENDMRYGEYQELRGSSRLHSNNNYIKLEPFENLTETMRQIKTADEIKKIEKAQLISQLAYEAIIKTIKVGQTEQEIAQTLQQIIRSLGAQELAFETIIASGPNSGIPHHVTGSRRLATRDIVLFDFGAKYQDYCADLSRVVFLGKADDRVQNIYNHVLTAQRKAIAKIAGGLKSSQAYHIAAGHFKKHKLSRYFLHGLGHGIGLDVHEQPYLRPSIYQPLEESMVFSVEPGLYFPWGGIRIEDLVTIKNRKSKILGKSAKELIQI